MQKLYLLRLKWILFVNQRQLHVFYKSLMGQIQIKIFNQYNSKESDTNIIKQTTYVFKNQYMRMSIKIKNI